MLAAAKDGFRLKPEQAAGLARRWLEQRLEEGNSHLTELVDTGDVHETQDGPEAVRESRAAQELSYMQEDHERGRAERWVTDDVDHAIREEGLPIKEGDESYRLLVDQFFWAAVALRQAMNARAFGDYRQPKQLEKLPDYKPVLANGNSAAKVHRLSDAVV